MYVRCVKSVTSVILLLLVIIRAIITSNCVLL